MHGFHCHHPMPKKDMVLPIQHGLQACNNCMSIVQNQHECWPGRPVTRMASHSSGCKLWTTFCALLAGAYCNTEGAYWNCLAVTFTCSKWCCHLVNGAENDLRTEMSTSSALKSQWRSATYKAIYGTSSQVYRGQSTKKKRCNDTGRTGCPFGENEGISASEYLPRLVMVDSAAFESHSSCCVFESDMWIECLLGRPWGPKNIPKPFTILAERYNHCTPVIVCVHVPLPSKFDSFLILNTDMNFTAMPPTHIEDARCISADDRCEENATMLADVWTRSIHCFMWVDFNIELGAEVPSWRAHST